MTERIHLSPRARATILWLSAALLLLFLWEVRDILTPFIWAIVTSYVLNPVVVFLARKTGMPRRVWAAIFYIVLLGALAWGLGTLVPLISAQVRELAGEMPYHFREAGRILGQSELDLLGVRINLQASDAEINRQIGLLFSQVGRTALSGALPHVAESLLKLLVYLVSTFFLLLEAQRIGETINHFTPPVARAELGPWVGRINHVLGAYIRGQLFLVVLMSVASYIALSILGVRFAPLLAVFTGLVETLPFIGPYIAGGTAVLVALTQGYTSFGWTSIGLAVAVAITYTVLRQLEDNFVMPVLIGRLTHLHPLLVIFVVLSGATIGGILGLLVAVPVAATVKVIISYLYAKFQEEPPRTLAIIDAGDDWDTITSRVREAVMVFRAAGGSRPRLLLSVPNPPSALLDPAQFHRLPVLLQESNAEGIVLTADSRLRLLAEDAGIVVRERVEDEPESVPRPVFGDEPHIGGSEEGRG